MYYSFSERKKSGDIQTTQPEKVLRKLITKAESFSVKS